ncbi:MAG: glutamate racemase [Flavobacteriales bacterium]|nr:glutamate racemase [Flavobacteriales bacterium]
MPSDSRPIGIFDSGIGGLTVMNTMRQALPRERLLYFGDTLHVPYGPRTLEEVRAFSIAIAEALLGKGCKLIVIACNTASAAALAELRQRWPEVPFVGMEPAVKPAVEQTHTGVVGVIATVATFQSELYASVVDRFAAGVKVLHQPCPGLVKQIEAGEFDTPATEALLRGWLEPMLAQGIDALVLGCTHYPIIRPLIERILGRGVRIIDPAPAVARQVARLLRERGLEAPPHAMDGSIIWTSGNPEGFQKMMVRMGMPPVAVGQAVWTDGSLSLV